MDYELGSPDGAIEHIVASGATILPSQFYGELYGRGRDDQWYKELARAVLKQSLDDLELVLRRPQLKRSRPYLREIDAWFIDDALDGPFSFGGICEMLSLDVSALRAPIMSAIKNAVEPPRMMRRMPVSIAKRPRVTDHARRRR